MCESSDEEEDGLCLLLSRYNLSNHVSSTNTFKNRLDSYWKYHPARYDWEASDYFHPGLANFDNKL